jgi:hypothetical protein
MRPSIDLLQYEIKYYPKNSTKSRPYPELSIKIWYMFAIIARILCLRAGKLKKSLNLLSSFSVVGDGAAVDFVPDILE